MKACTIVVYGFKIVVSILFSGLLLFDLDIAMLITTECIGSLQGVSLVINDSISNNYINLCKGLQYVITLYYTWSSNSIVWLLCLRIFV